jgi:hypothetical protein
MSKSVIAGIIIVAAIGLGYFCMSVSYSNSYIGKNNALTKADSDIVARADTMWKVMTEQFGVANSFADKFKDTYVGMMEGRHMDKGGSLFKMVSESHPQLPDGLWAKVQDAIQAERHSFEREQKVRNGIATDINNLVQKFPGSHFLGGKELAELKVIASGETKAIIESGEDNRTLFNSNSK